MSYPDTTREPSDVYPEDAFSAAHKTILGLASDILKSTAKLKQEVEALYGHEHTFVDGKCDCGKPCPACHGTKFITVDTFNGEHDQYETMCECSVPTN